jgi:hypothetical protein
MGLALALKEPQPLVVSPPRGLTRSAQCLTCGISLSGLLGCHSCALALDFACFVLCCRCLTRCFIAGAQFQLFSCGFLWSLPWSWDFTWFLPWLWDFSWAFLLCVKGSAKKIAPCGLLSAWCWCLVCVDAKCIKGWTRVIFHPHGLWVYRLVCWDLIC